MSFETEHVPLKNPAAANDRYVKMKEAAREGLVVGISGSRGAKRIAWNLAVSTGIARIG